MTELSWDAWKAQSCCWPPARSGSPPIATGNNRSRA